jgi:hypothetical protein
MPTHLSTEAENNSVPTHLSTEAYRRCTGEASRILELLVRLSCVTNYYLLRKSTRLALQ